MDKCLSLLSELPDQIPERVKFSRIKISQNVRLLDYVHRSNRIKMLLDVLYPQDIELNKGALADYVGKEPGLFRLEFTLVNRAYRLVDREYAGLLSPAFIKQQCSGAGWLGPDTDHQIAAGHLIPRDYTEYFPVLFFNLIDDWRQDINERQPLTADIHIDSVDLFDADPDGDITQAPHDWNIRAAFGEIRRTNGILDDNLDVVPLLS